MITQATTRLKLTSRGSRRWSSVLALLAVLTIAASAQTPSRTDLERARQLYQRTEYGQAQRILSAIGSPNAEVLTLLGQVYYGQGEYKKATDTLEAAAEKSPRSSNIALWLGRAYGRRAETSSFLTAPRYASRTREYFEKALALDARNQEAADDLLEYYLQAPGFLGGGIDKAEALAAKMASRNPLQSERAYAKISEEKKEYPGAERHLRKAIELAPGNAGPMVDLATFLARRNRVDESDRVFAQAALAAPKDPEVAFARARTFIDQKRRLGDARVLLETYIESDLTPDQPSRQEARELLKKTR